jgi:isoleucyl-tRNA synthetase
MTNNADYETKIMQFWEKNKIYEKVKKKNEKGQSLIV